MPQFYGDNYSTGTIYPNAAALQAVDTTNLIDGTRAQVTNSGAYQFYKQSGTGDIYPTVGGGSWHLITNPYLLLNSSNEIDGSQLQSVGDISLTDGTAASPSLNFENDIDTGIFRPTTNCLSITNGGVETIRFDANNNVGIGLTTFPVQNTAGRKFLSIKGSTLSGCLEFSTAQADADAVNAGIISFTDVNSVAADKRVGTIAAALNGSTANNRGGALVFSVKSDGGLLSSRARLNTTGLFIGTNTNAINALDVNAGAVIGASYAGVNTAPTNGLLVQGGAAFGATSVGTATYLFSQSGQNTFRIESTTTASSILALKNSSLEFQCFIDTTTFYIWSTSSKLTIVASTGDVAASVGNLVVGAAGKGLQVKEGTNAKMGTAILGAGGTVTVSNTSVTATSRILITSQVDGGTPGFLRISARVVGTSFTITSSNAADTSTVAWVMFEPAP